MLFGFGFRKQNKAQRRYQQRVVETSLKAKIRSGSGHGINTKALIVVVAVILVAGLVFAVWFGVKFAKDYLFAKDGFYAIKSIEINEEERLVRSFIVNRYGIKEGANLFSFDIRRVQYEFIKTAPSVKEMQIYRILPNTLRVEIVKRIPLARVGKDGTLVVDTDGRVFVPDTENKDKAIISGIRGNEIRPGDNLTGIMMDAITVLDLCDKTILGQELGIVKIDVRGGFGGRDDSIRLELKDGTEVDLWWNRLKGQEESMTDLTERLRFLAGIMRKSRQDGKAYKNINLTPDDYKRNCSAIPKWN